MVSIRQPARQLSTALFAAGMVALGIVALVYGDFAMVWQPVPDGLPGRTALAYASGVLMLLCSVGLLVRGTAAWAARILFPYLVTWTALKIPALCVAPKIEGVWLGFGELAVLLAGGWVLLARLGGLGETGWTKWFAGDSGVRIARYWFAVWLVPIGLSHFFYTQATVDLIPAWIPGRTFFAWLTGAGHIAAGLGVLFSVVPRIAVVAEAGMLTVITVLVWIPAVIAKPHDRLSWTALSISWAITAAVWAVAQSFTASKADPSHV